MGSDALARSKQLMAGSREMMAAYGWPFVALILAVSSHCATSYASRLQTLGYLELASQRS
jgi:hypothetical protein